MRGGWSIRLVCCAAAILPAGSAGQGADDLAPAYADHQDLTYVLDGDGGRRPIRTRADWEARRAHIVSHFSRVLGPMPAAPVREPLDVKIEEETPVGDGLRRKLSYVTSRGERVPAYLLLPPRSVVRRPAVLCLHQTTAIGKDEPVGLGGDPDQHIALELARQGYVVLVPDYPSLGEHAWDFDPARGYASGTMKAIRDNIRGIDLLSSLEEVDPERIGCIGHSLGGHNAIFTAVFEPRIRAVVSSCGFSTFLADDVPSWTGPRYMPRIASEFRNDPARIPFDFPELIAALAPRPFFASAPLRDDDFAARGVRDAMAAAAPVYDLFGAADRLSAIYPDAPHAFPPEARRLAYAFLDRHLKPLSR